MNASVGQILDRDRPHPIATVGPNDFAVSSHRPIQAQKLFDADFEPYCFDPESREVLLVRCDDPEAVEAAPFYYQAQAEGAVELARIPFDEFCSLAKPAEIGGRLILIHSTGRCGSTLVSKALQAVTAVRSLSEPDELTQLAKLWVNAQLSDEDTSRLLRATCQWRGRRAEGKLALKFRAEVCVLADFFAAEFPKARHVFLYRDATSWMQSIFNGWPESLSLYDAEGNRKMEEGWARTLPIVREYIREDAPMNPVQVRTLAWISCMESYFHLLGRVPITAIRFEDLTAQPLPTLRELFAFCGIDAVDWEAINQVLAKDSQAGTIYDREARKKLARPMPPENIQDVLQLVASRQKLKVPDIVLPSS